MASVKFNLKNPDLENKNETLIYMFFSFEGGRLKYSTGESVKPLGWNKIKRRVVSSVSGSKEINENLDKLEEDVKRIYRKAISNEEFVTPEMLRERLLFIKTGKSSKYTLFSFIEGYIESVKNVKAKATITIYKNTLNHLKEYKIFSRRNVDFNTINLDFYNDFTDYLLTEKKFATNTIAKNIKILKAFLSEATERGINTKIDFKSKKFRVITEDSESIYLNEEELMRLYKFDFSKNECFEKVRDLFIVGCWTGLRFSDFSQIKKENINDGFINIVTQKTDQPVSIPFYQIVTEIMKKYADKYPNSLPPAISNQKMNEYLKDIGKDAGFDEDVVFTKTKGNVKVKTTFKKWQLITTHTARRSFATNLYLAGFPTISIMQITTHKTEKAFLKYIKVKPKENAIKLQQFWQEKERILKEKEEELRKKEEKLIKKGIQNSTGNKKLRNKNKK